MLTATKTRATAQDYEALPEGARYQLIEGELIVTPSATFSHQDIVYELAGLLRAFLRKHRLGEAVGAPMDVFLDNDNAFQPDVLFIRTERLNIIKRGRVYGAPDIVMEVLSPSNAYYDLNEKKSVYERNGVREYWIVDSVDKSIDILANRESGFELIFAGRYVGEATSEVLPGFSVSLEHLFRF